MARNFQNFHMQIKTQIQDLRDTLTGLSSNERYLRLVNEFIDESEFGLALETLCDYLLDPDTRPASKSVIQQIQSLHELMGTEDRCVRKLKQKADLTG